MSARVAALQQHFERIHREHMQGLPIVNARLAVEAIGFREQDAHLIGVLVTPWFMNLVLLSGTDEWLSVGQGSTVEYSLPAGDYEFTVSRDGELGTYLTAVLFRTVADFPDQDTAREIAETILDELYHEPQSPGTTARTYNRREFFAQLGER